MAADDDARPDENDYAQKRIVAMIGLCAGLGLLATGAYGAFLLFTQYSNRLDFIGVTAATGIITLMIYFGGRLIANASSTRKDVIPPADRKLLEPLITGGEEKAIDQYVRLSSLTGATGTATKLGLTGLPLLTVALTLIFSGLEIYAPNKGFLDLGKLSLGAFIGSFVQRTATTQAVTEQERRASSAAPPPV